MSSRRATSRLSHYRNRALATYDVLLATYPDAECELIYSTPLELLVATMMSAQTTDKQVNKVTPALFRRFPDAASFAVADVDEVAEMIKTVGFFRNKARSIVAMAGQLVDDYGGEVPATLAELVKLPGVGRKTANVVLGNAFDVPGLTPDTHFMRVTRRLGWTDAEKPDPIEHDIAELFDPKVWTKLSHVLIWHGRQLCRARRPLCAECPLGGLRSAGEAQSESGGCRYYDTEFAGE